MGFFKSIVNFVKKIAHGVRDAFRAVRKGFSKLMSNKAFRMVMFAATVWNAGAALYGAFQTGFTAASGGGFLKGLSEVGNFVVGKAVEIVTTPLDWIGKGMQKAGTEGGTLQSWGKALSDGVGNFQKDAANIFTMKDKATDIALGTGMDAAPGLEDAYTGGGSGDVAAEGIIEQNAPGMGGDRAAAEGVSGAGGETAGGMPEISVEADRLGDMTPGVEIPGAPKVDPGMDIGMGDISKPPEEAGWLSKTMKSNAVSGTAYDMYQGAKGLYGKMGDLEKQMLWKAVEAGLTPDPIDPSDTFAKNWAFRDEQAKLNPLKTNIGEVAGKFNPGFKDISRELTAGTGAGPRPKRKSTVAAAREQRKQDSRGERSARPQREDRGRGAFSEAVRAGQGGSISELAGLGRRPSLFQPEYNSERG